MSSSWARLPTPQGPGSVSGGPNLPAGFTGTFTSRYVDTGELRQHVVTGGQGPPLLLDDVQSVLIHGCGHYCLEEAPEEVLEALTAFLAPYRESI